MKNRRRRFSCSLSCVSCPSLLIALILLSLVLTAPALAAYSGPRPAHAGLLSPGDDCWSRKIKSIGQTPLPAQEAAPDLPGDATRVYYADAMNRAMPLPFETGLASLNLNEIARSTRVGYVELKGATAETVLDQATPRFYVFVADRMDPPPHQLLRLGGAQKDKRRFTVVVEKGLKGFSPVAVENVELQYRIVERLQVDAGRNRVLFINYMEIRPRHPLSPGEYAIIGNSLSDIATFRIK